jgi:hypothetical protein
VTDIEKLVRAWAEASIEDQDGPRDKRELTLRLERERTHVDPLRRAMATLPPPTYCAALLHHVSPRAARDIVREVERITQTPMSRRSFWDHLDRVNHFVAGFHARR